MLEGHVHGPQGRPGVILIRYPDSMSSATSKSKDGQARGMVPKSDDSNSENRSNSKSKQ